MWQVVVAIGRRLVCHDRGSELAALASLAIVLRPFGLAYEVAIPLRIIIDPLADMVRTMLNVAISFVIPILAGGRTAMPTTQSSR